MTHYRFRLNVSWSQFQRYYCGSAEMVVVTCEDGKVLHIHARHFRPLLSAAGLQGRYQLTLTETNQFHSLTRIEF